MNEYVVLFKGNSSLEYELSKENNDFILGEIIKEEDGMDYAKHGIPMYEKLTTIRVLETGEEFTHNNMAHWNEYSFAKVSDIEKNANKIIDNCQRKIEAATKQIDKTTENVRLVEGMVQSKFIKDFEKIEVPEEEKIVLNDLRVKLTSAQEKLDSYMKQWMEKRVNENVVIKQQERVSVYLGEVKQQENKIIKTALKNNGFEDVSIGDMKVNINTKDSNGKSVMVRIDRDKMTVSFDQKENDKFKSRLTEYMEKAKNDARTSDIDIKGASLNMGKGEIKPKR